MSSHGFLESAFCVLLKYFYFFFCEQKKCVTFKRYLPSKCLNPAKLKLWAGTDYTHRTLWYQVHVHSNISLKCIKNSERLAELFNTCLACSGVITFYTKVMPLSFHPNIPPRPCKQELISIACSAVFDGLLLWLAATVFGTIPQTG